ncbi:MAG: hypothetical protein A2044_04810 [Candidatus Firestonebacteria bacterium GWA2_43_8]|nr:MAG: hypothetical protein A2044_04810 [Candidatus Firestonebacteria bacterium GWA2_43_8]
MSRNIDKYKLDLDKLVKTGEKYFDGLLGTGPKTSATSPNISADFVLGYQKWYTEAYAVVKQLIPDRLRDFEEYYRLEKRKTIGADNYTIKDYLVGLSVTRGLAEIPVFDIHGVAILKFKQQLLILDSIQSRFESTLFDIEQLVLADLFDSELETAEELLKKGFLRASGNIAGVVLEKHLKGICDKHSIETSKSNPTISDLNYQLKTGSVYDIPNWRLVQRLGDIRNYCDHKKEREPTLDEVKDLVEGTKKIIKTIF